MIRRIRIEAEETLQHLGSWIHWLNGYKDTPCADVDQYEQVSQCVAHPLDTLGASRESAHIFIICIKRVQ